MLTAQAGPGLGRVWLLDHAPIMGGAERFALRLLGYAERTGRYEVAIACPPGSELAERARSLGIEVLQVEFPDLAPWLLGRQVPAVAHTRRLLAQAGGRAVVIANTARTQAYAVAAAAVMRRPPGLVHVAHEQFTAYRRTAGLALRRRGALVAVGANAAAAYRTNIPEVPVDKINNFLLPDEFTELREGRRAAHGGRVVAVIARMIPEKGVLELVQELGSNPDVWAELLVAAPAEDPRYEAKVRSAVSELGLSHRIKLLGQVEDVPGLLRQVDVVVVPSTGPEGQPGVILEALAAGTPVVMRRPLYSADYADLPAFRYVDANDLGSAIETAAGTTAVPVAALLERFGPEQALAGIERAARRTARELPSAGHG